MATDIKNYTPLFDKLVFEFDVNTAAVFGRVWRYCKMERGHCHAGQDRIADKLNLSRATVNKCLRLLVENGYLGTSKNTKGRTVIYYDTGKASREEMPEFTPPADTQNAEPVNSPVKEPVKNSDTKKEKKEKKNTTTIKGGGEFSFSEKETIAEKEFLSKASEEQKSAFQYARLFAGVQKSIERASKDNPIEAARGFLLGISKHGDTLEKREMANKALAELPSPVLPEESTKPAKAETRTAKNEQLEREFSNRAEDDQWDAYKLLKPLVGVEKAIEKASEEDPITAARALVEYLAVNGNSHSIRVGAEKAMKSYEVETLSENPETIKKLARCAEAYEWIMSYLDEYVSEFDRHAEYRIDKYRNRIKHIQLEYFFSKNYELLRGEKFRGHEDELQEIIQGWVHWAYKREFQEEDAKREVQHANF